jgi:HK97 family phage major capsid protein
MSDPKLTGENATAVEEVRDELKRLGDNHKEAVDQLNTAWEAFKKEHTEALEKGTEGLGDVQEKLDKHISEIVTRVEDMQAKSTERIDQLETKMLRPTMGGNPIDLKNYEKDMAAAMEWKALEFSSKGVKFNEEKLEAEANIDELKAYEKIFNKYFRHGDRMLSVDEMKALSVGSDADGGYFVRPQLSNRIIERMYELSPVRALASVERISTDALDVPAETDTATAGWTSEQATRTETTAPKIGMITITAQEMYAMPAATQKLLEDSFVNIDSWVTKHVSKRMARLEGTALILGDGVGKPRGLVTYPAWAAAGVYEYGKLEQVNTGATGGATYPGLLNIQAALMEAFRGNATWLWNRKFLAAVLQIQDGASRYIFVPQVFATGLIVPSVLGHPFRLCPDLVDPTSNSLSLVFGDIREGYQIADRIGISVLRDPFTAKPFVLFYTRMRVGGAVVDFESIKIGKCAT